MPPRRSTRAGSAKPAEKPATRQAAKPAAKPTPKPAEKPAKAATKAAAKPTKTAEKPPAKSTARGRPAATTKRVASPENSPPPPAKRSRAAPRIVENGADAIDDEVEPAPRLKKAPATKKPTQKKPSPVHTQDKPYFNPLPTPPAHDRPAPLLFVWGTGNFGQFGMGADFLGEYDKPTRNKWVEKNIEAGVFGDTGASLEAVAAGGLHSLFLDEKGVVSFASSTSQRVRR